MIHSRAYFFILLLLLSMWMGGCAASKSSIYSSAIAHYSAENYKLASSEFALLMNGKLAAGLSKRQHLKALTTWLSCAEEIEQFLEAYKISARLLGLKRKGLGAESLAEELVLHSARGLKAQELESAELSLEESLNLFRKNKFTRNPSYLQSSIEYAKLLSILKKWKDADRAWQQTFDEYQQQQGSKDIMLAEILRRHSLVKLQLEQSTMGLELLETAIGICESIAAKYAIGAYKELSSCLYAKARLHEALSSLEQSAHSFSLSAQYFEHYLRARSELGESQGASSKEFLWLKNTWQRSSRVYGIIENEKASAEAAQKARTIDERVIVN